MGLAVSFMVKPSGVLHYLLMLLSGLTIVCLCYIGEVMLGFLQAFFVGLFVFISIALVAFSFVRWSRSRELFQLEVGEDYRVILRRLDSAFQVVHSESLQLCSPLIVWSQLLVLHVKDQSGNKKTIWIPSDSVEAESFRKLTVIATYLVGKKSPFTTGKNLSDGNF